MRRLEIFEEMKPSAFSRLPPRLQVDFFEYAEEAARRTIREVISERDRLSKIKDLLKFRDIPEILDRDLRVGAVDGSSSPTFSDRLGYRIGVYTACYMVFDGPNIISDKDDENMEGGYLMVNQVGNILQTRKILSLLMTIKEREMALKCLKKYDVDLLLVDGSFYGFRTRCSEIKNVNLEKMGIEGYKTGLDLINRALVLTRELIRVGKAVGVIKRLRTSAIDGWLLSNRWNIDDILHRNDRSILRTLLPPGRYFDYRDLLGEEWSYLHYSNLITWYDELRERNIVSRDSLEESRLEALRYVHKKLETQIRTDLCPTNVDEKVSREMCKRLLNEITSRIRIHARLSPYAAPICLELGEEIDLDTVLAYTLKIVNKATGIPFPIDLVDEVISVDKELAKEFAEEVEARLLLDSRISSEEVEARLEPLNPQKED
ncbi:MAG: DNA double-strand break repair nuclease NurA [Aigarchaeota archaeon]|nr:DNA double-strand break repair nuclease NurA [Aigarchaeota archaeon]MDW7985620.1 DNA double-strand break repair nuclease NurA [Nitrososphaerota archaeon]